MKPIRVLVVDDSALARLLIVSILSTDDEIEVVGEAEDGKEALEKVRELKPDLVTMDIEMPVMNGLEAIEQIMAFNPVPILVVTARGDAQTAFAAISKGALDLVEKPAVSLENAREFVEKIKFLSKITVITHLKGKYEAGQIREAQKPERRERDSDKIVAIASSTGGPNALSILISALPADFPCPIVIAQHISDGFISGLVEWLKRISRLDIKIASEGETIRKGTIYFSPSESHIKINRRKIITFVKRRPEDIYRPSCDILLSSVADVYGAKSIGIILTGMGKDGALGIKRIKELGGKTIAQNEQSSVVFGMPRVAIESGYVDKVLSINEIGKEIIRLVMD